MHIPCKQIKDSDLVLKSIQDSNYFFCLYNRYEKKLKRYIKRISNLPEEEISDILQDSFIKIWKNLNDYDSDIALSSWIYRIVHNQSISHWRKLQSFGKANKISFEEYFINSNVEEMSPQNFENEGKIQEIIHQLTINYQSVLILRYFENKDYEEISDILKIPEGTVATRLNRAKKSFSKLAKINNITFFD